MKGGLASLSVPLRPLSLSSPVDTLLCESKTIGTSLMPKGDTYFRRRPRRSEPANDIGPLVFQLRECRLPLESSKTREPTIGKPRKTKGASQPRPSQTGESSTEWRMQHIHSTYSKNESQPVEVGSFVIFRPPSVSVWPPSSKEARYRIYQNLGYQFPDPTQTFDPSRHSPGCFHARCTLENVGDDNTSETNCQGTSTGWLWLRKRHPISNQSLFRNTMNREHVPPKVQTLCISNVLAVI